MTSIENLFALRSKRVQFCTKEKDGMYVPISEGVEGKILSTDAEIVKEFLGEKPEIGLINPLINVLKSYYVAHKPAKKK